MNQPKSHDNSIVSDFLSGYFHAGDVCERHPQVDDIFSGALGLKTPGNSATRTLSRKVLFQILQSCQVIDVESISQVTCRQYKYSTVAVYSATARVISKALHRFIMGLPLNPEAVSVREARDAIDAPYRPELLALGLV